MAAVSGLAKRLGPKPSGSVQAGPASWAELPWIVLHGGELQPELQPFSVADELLRRPYGELVVTVVEYDPSWPERFEALRAEYAAAMAAARVPVKAIEHVGSTSVPGLAAKPVIDCDIVVGEADVTAASSVLVSLGFTPEGELGIPQRWAFKEPERLSGTNTYMIVDGCLSLRNHLAVRDVLRAYPILRDTYAAVKRKAAACAANIDEYGQIKTPMVQKLLAAAGLTDAERASIAGNQVPSHDELPR